MPNNLVSGFLALFSFLPFSSVFLGFPLSGPFFLSVPLPEALLTASPACVLSYSSISSLQSRWATANRLSCMCPFILLNQFLAIQMGNWFPCVIIRVLPPLPLYEVLSLPLPQPLVHNGLYFIFFFRHCQYFSIQ